MAIRINQAKNFKGKAYVAADELDSLIQTLNFAGYTQTGSANTWKLQFKEADGGTSATTIAADLTAIKDYIDNKSITVSAGDGITINTSNPLDPVIATKIKLVSTTATSGYAASYKLQVWDNSANSGAGDWKDAGDSSATIDIVKDQFIQNAEFGWSSKNDASGDDFTTTKTAGYFPTLHIAVWTNVDGDTSSSDATPKDIYVPLNDVFVDKTAGNGIDADQLASNVIAVKIDTTTDARTIITTSGAAGTDLIAATASGIVVGDVQGAIDVAVNDEHAKAAAAVSALDDKIDAVQADANSAVTALNTNVASAFSAINALDSKTDSAFAAVDTAIDNAITSTVTNINGAITSSVAAVNAKVSSAVSSINSNIVEVAGNAQTAVQTVGAAVDALDSKVNSKLDTLANDINTAISAVESAVTAHTANAVQIMSATVTMTQDANATSATGNVASALHIIGVFDSDSNQIYPEIIKSGSGYNFVAEFAPNTSTSETWTVYYTTALTAYSSVSAAIATDYAPAEEAVADTTVGAGTSGSYADATASSATAVSAADTTYNTSTVSVTGATAPGVQSDVAIGALSYKPN